MKKACVIIMLLLVMAGHEVLAETIPAVMSCRTRSGSGGDYSLADTCNADSSKLTVRAGDPATDRGEKSWIRFELGDLVVSNLSAATLKLTLQAAKTGSVDLSAVADAVVTNIAWTDHKTDGTGLTWNNAPGNDTVSFAAVDPAQTTPVTRFDYDGVAGDAITIDVLSILQADTDGIVQFILHNASGETNFCTHDHATPAYRPVLEVTVPAGYPVIGNLREWSAVQSCRAEIEYPTTNRSDSSKLSVRSDASAAKSWIKFDVGDLDVDNLRQAVLTVALHEAEGGVHTVDLSAVNDDCNSIAWTASSLTWNNAPANETASRTDLVAAKATFVKTIPVTDGIIGTAYPVDVLSVLEADTDGIVQFVLHNSDVLMNFATHNHPVADYRPTLTVVEAPLGADYPTPYPGQHVQTDLAALTWTNPDPNDGTSSITCTVYLGTEPNRLAMDRVTLAPDVATVAVNPGNFPGFVPLTDKTVYYWTVDCDDPGAGVIDGLMWSFETDNNQAPTVDAGADQVTYGLPKVIALNGTTSDDGQPGPTYTLLWTQVDNDAPPVSISPDAVEDTTVTITEAGVYAFTLTADDGDKTASDTVQIVVGTDACQASHLTGAPYAPGDVNQDCLVNLHDFAALIAADWLNCTDTLAGCD
jgi:hypothetical protein